MKFDRRFPGVSETRRTLPVCVGGGRVNKPQGGEPRKPRATPWEPWRSERTSPERAIQLARSAFAFVGNEWAAPSGLGNSSWDESPRALPWAGIGPRLRRYRADRCLVDWVDSATALRYRADRCLVDWVDSATALRSARNDGLRFGLRFSTGC
jgi:hypothetical protein